MSWIKDKKTGLICFVVDEVRSAINGEVIVPRKKRGQDGV